MIFAELLGRHGDVTQRVRVERFPFRVGRAYTNDLVVDDPHALAEHVVVEEGEDGSLTVREGAAPGAPAGAERRESLPRAGEALLELGRTHLRLRDRDFPVPPAAPIVRRTAPIEWLFGHWSGTLTIYAAVALVRLARFQQDTWRETEWVAWVNPALWEVSLLAIWAGGWALLTRLLARRPRYSAHVAVAGLLALLSSAIDEGLQVVRFAIPSIAFAQWADVAISGALAGALLLGHLRVAHAGSARQRAFAGVAAALLLFGVRSLQLVSRQPNWVSVLPYWSRLEPIPVSWLPRESVEEYFDGTKRLEDELAAAAEKP